MFEVNDSEYENNSYTLFGPMGMAFYHDGNYLDETYTVKIILSIYLGVTMVLNIIGNVCTCAVIARNRSMRTPTNCYLFNIAITDLITGFFVPIDIYIIWFPDFYPLGEVGCRLHYILWDFLLNYSLLIITAFTLERYLVVTRPFLRQKLALNSRVYKITGGIWLICAVFIIPDVFYIDLLERKKYVFCYFTISAGIHSAFAGFEVFAFSVVPMVVITVLYVLIFIELKSEKRKLRASPVVVQHNKDKAIKMLGESSNNLPPPSAYTVCIQVKL